MFSDIRLSDHNKIDDYVALTCDAISIGNEGCEYKVPAAPEVTKIGERVIEHGKRFKLVTPILFGSAGEAVVSIIEHVCAHFKKNIEIVFNDLSILPVAQKMTQAYGSVFTAGRFLAASFLNDPWRHLYLDEEDEHVRQWYLSSDFNERHKKSLYKEYGVSGVEENMFEEARASFGELSDDGFRVNIHHDAYNISITRCCHTARFFDAQLPHCSDRCNEIVTATLSDYYPYSKMNDPDGDYFLPVDDQMRAVHPEYCVCGNIIQASPPCRDMKKFERCCDFIFDSRWWHHSMADLQQHIVGMQS